MVVAGAASAISGALLDVLLQAGQDPGLVTPPGLSISVPAPYAVVVLVVIAGALGWAGLAYLWQAQKLMHSLEFDYGVEPDEIKATLSGSSIASASIRLFKLLCLISIISSTSIIVGVVYFFHFLVMQNIEPSVSLYMTFSVLIEIPYLLVMFNPRMRYFQPSNWDASTWFFQLVMKDDINEVVATGYSIEYDSLPSQVSGQDAVKIADDLMRYIPQVYAISINSLIRQHGLKLIKDWKNFETMMFAVLEKVFERKVRQYICREFTDLEPEEQTILKNYFVALLW